MKQITETTNFLEAQIKDITGGFPAAVIEKVVPDANVIATYNGKEIAVTTAHKFEGGEVVPVISENEGTIKVGKAIDCFKEAEFIKTLIITNNYISTL